jgi:4-amino-4-deoxy-L-arabinose transferase-like glycosyltransferase
MLIVSILALLIRSLYLTQVISLHASPQHDGLAYHMLARNLVSGAGYSLNRRPTAFRPPGYPLFLMAIYSSVGPNIAVVRLIHMLLGAVVTALAYATARSGFRRCHVGLIAAFGTALHPVLVYLTGRILSETLAIPIAMLAVWIMVSHPRGLSAGKALLLSCLIAMLVLIRPAALLFVPFVASWFLILSLDKTRALRQAAVLICVVALFLAPWVLRNYLTFGEFIPLATEGGVTFWGGNNPLASGGVVEPSPETWPAPDPPAGIAGWPGLSQKESEDRFYAAAFEWIRTHPGDFIALIPKKALRAWSLSFGSETKASGLPGWVRRAYALFPILGLVGFALSLQRWQRLLPIYFLILSSNLTILAFYGSTRQSAILIPSVTILAAFAVRGSLLVIRKLVLRLTGGL